MKRPSLFCFSGGAMARIACILALGLLSCQAFFPAPVWGAVVNLMLTGGEGGSGGSGGVGGSGGQGGYMRDDAQVFWVGGGGGGGSGSAASGGSGSGGGGGGNGGAGGSGSSSGSGGNGNNQAGNSVPGEAGSGGSGGAGGGFINQSYAGGSYTVTGGGGGTGPNGAGGKGGDAALSIAGGSYSEVFITGGSVNAGGSPGTIGGNGGSAGLIVSGTLDAIMVTVTSGNSATGPGISGSGGAAGLTADTLTAAIINLARPGGASATNVGALTFTVNTLDMVTVRGSSTTLTLDNTTAWNGSSGVRIGTALLDNNKTFIVTSVNGGVAAIDTLNVIGVGGTVDAPVTQRFGTVNLAGGSSLTSVTPLNFGTMRVLDPGANYIGDLYAGPGQSLSFVLPANPAPGQTMLSVQGNADIVAGSLDIVYAGARPGISEGESLTLISASSLSGQANGFTVHTPDGDFYAYRIVGNQLQAELLSIAYEQLRAFAEARVASLALVNQGADLILNQGYASALGVTSGPGLKSGAFGAASGGYSRYRSGSHIDVSGVSMLAGLALGSDAGPGRLTLGAFFEGGFGDYSSYNSFARAASVDGRGDSSYYGGGILARYSLNRGLFSGLYAEGSARAGRVDTDFRSGDIRYGRQGASFETGAEYFGLHGGLGLVVNATDKASFDLSAKVIWTRQSGDSVNVHDDRVRFEQVDSLRSRLGGRFAYALNDYVAPYAGAYWEHEFDGRQKIAVNGRGLGTPSLRGDTGMGELGLSVRPSQTLPLSFDLGVQGYAGRREGVTGSLQLKLEF